MTGSPCQTAWMAKNQKLETNMTGEEEEEEEKKEEKVNKMIPIDVLLYS